MELRWTGVCLDCPDAEVLAEFYATLLGWEVVHRSGDWFQVADPAGGVHLNLQSDPAFEPPVWPEQAGRPGKQLHFEIEVDDVSAGVAHAVAGGATEAPWQPPDRDPSEASDARPRRPPVLPLRRSLIRKTVGVRRWRSAVAHVATPWRWRARWRVVVLVVVMVGVTVASAIDGFLDNGVLSAVFSAVVGTVLLAWPAIRSLRRWDASHAASV